MKATWCFVAVGLGLVSAVEVAEVNAQAPCPWPAPPQLLADRPSLPDSAMVEIGANTMKLCYSRPSARGRTIFGELVPFGRPWRTGANEPTMLHLSANAIVAGVALNAGTYILLTVPGEDKWQILFNTTTASNPDEMFNALTEVGRGEVPVERTSEYVETLTIRFEQDPSPELVLEWENTRVRVPIDSSS